MSIQETVTPAAARRDLSGLRIPREEEPRPRRRRMPGWLIAVVVLIGLAASAWSVLGRLDLFPVEVTTAPVLSERAHGSGSEVSNATGHVVARTKASVSSKVAGRLETLNVEEGSVVKEGDVLARIDHSDVDAQVEAARSAAAEARARLLRAEAVRDQAEKEIARQKKLLADGVASPQAFDAAEAAARSARAEVAEARAAVTTAQAQARLAEVSLENTYVRAPFSGTVLRKEADVGESVAPAIAAGSTTRGAIVTMADLSRLDVEVDVSESNISRVKPEMAAEVALDAVPDRRYRARVRQIVPTADRQKATIEIKVALLDPDDRVKPEMSARVTFLSAEPDAKALALPPVITAPAGAVAIEGAAASVFTVADGVVHRKSVTVGERRGERIVIASGLAAGDSVVVDPRSGLEDGQRVKVKADGNRDNR